MYMKRKKKIARPIFEDDGSVTLPQLTVRRSNDPLYRMKMKSQRTGEDPTTAMNDWYDQDNVDRQTAERLYEIYMKAGSPDIYPARDKSTRRFVDTWGATNYYPLMPDVINTNSFDGIVPSLANMLQARYGNASRLSSVVRQMMNPYYDPRSDQNTSQYETRRYFEPGVENYIYNGTTGTVDNMINGIQRRLPR